MPKFYAKYCLDQTQYSEIHVAAIQLNIPMHVNVVDRLAVLILLGIGCRDRVPMGDPERSETDPMVTNATRLKTSKSCDQAGLRLQGTAHWINST